MKKRMKKKRESKSPQSQGLDCSNLNKRILRILVSTMKKVILL